ncbi:MAG: VWA domain-containing protein [Candidatus Aminicenantes bacterium]|nr:VWA domain-containing protein [Candidatus Aminicenantes bacterium]
MKKEYLLQIFCFVLTVLMAIHLTYGQEQKKDDSLQHEASVTLKLIQVYVSYKDGNPVQDLTKEDFILYDNGQPMTVTDFEIHSLIPPAKKETENIPLRMGRKFYLFLDAYRNDGMGLIKARTTAVHFIDTQVHPEDELGLISYSIGRGLILHIPLTSDHSKIRETVKTIKLFPWMTPTNNGETDMSEALDFTESFNDFAVSLRYIPGYKHIILFSAGLPRSLFQTEDPRLLSEHEGLAKELASSSCSLYTVDTQGQRDLAGGREQNGDDFLRQLASLTGGRHFNNVNHKEVISESVQNSTGFYYVLGYSVDEDWDGEFHEIKVKVERKGIRIQAQKGYFNPKPFAKFSKLEERLHLIDLARNPSPQFDLPEEIQSHSGLWENANSPIILNLTEIIPTRLEEIFADKTELFTLVYDSEGELVAEGKKDLDFTEDFPERICAYTFFLQPPGRYDYITVLRNIKTGKAAKAINTIVVPEFKENSRTLSNPFLFIPGRRSLSLQVEMKSSKEKSEPSPLNMEAIAPQVAGPVSPLVFELNKDTPIFYAIFGLGDKVEDKQNFKFAAQLKSDTTGEIHLLKILKRNDIHTLQNNTQVLALELIPILAGKYVLEISVMGSDPSESQIYFQDLFIR